MTVYTFRRPEIRASPVRLAVEESSRELREETAARRVKADWMRTALVPIFITVVAVGLFSTYLYTVSTGTSDGAFAAVWPPLVATVGIVVVASSTIYFTSVREAEFTPTHATFLVGLRRIPVAWEDLTAPRAPAAIGITFGYRRDGITHEGDGLFMTRKIARALLEDPHCPKFSMDVKVWQSLGLTPPAPR